MPEKVLEQIDKRPKDQQVDVKEIQDALKEGFFDKQENRDALQNEFNGKPERAISQLAKSFDNALHVAISDLTNKIKANQALTPQDVKLLKLHALMDRKMTYKNVDFGNTDWTKDVTIWLFATNINPRYQQVPLGQKLGAEMLGSKDIQNDIPTLNKSLTETYEMMGDFLMNIQATMKAPGSTDYRLNNAIIDAMSKFLQDNPLKPCTSYADYQKQTKNIADFFNAGIHSNGLLDGKKNPAYEYFQRNASVYTGSMTVGPDICIKFGNMLKAMGNIKFIKDKESIKGSYYDITREMLGESTLYTLKQEASLGSFSQGQNMDKLQWDVLNSEKMQQYPDLKIVADFLKNMKAQSQKEGQNEMDLSNQFDALISKLNGKVPTNIILFIKKDFAEKKEDIQKAIDVMTSGESLANLATIAGMQVLGEVMGQQKTKLSEGELVVAGEYYLKHGEFQPNIMTLFQMQSGGKEGPALKQYVQDLIKAKTKTNIIKQRNMVIYNRLSRFALTSTLSSDPKRADKLYKENPLFKVYNKVEGIGDEGGTSDADIQKWKSKADQIVVSIAITAFSGGVGSAAAGALLGGFEAAATTVGSRLILFAAKMIVEGVVFHATNTVLNAAVSGDRKNAVEELKNPSARARSVLYMLTMNGVGRALNLGILKMGAPLLKQGVNPAYFAALSKGLQVPMEVAGMMATDQIVSLTFDQKFQKITMEGMIQTMTLVIGLKMAHKIVPMTPAQGDIASDEVHVTGLTEKEGVVTDISYTQKVMKTIDAKVDYLAKLMKIKSGVRSSAATNILNSIDISLVKEPGKDYTKPLQEVKKTIEQLRLEGKSSKNLEAKYNEIVGKTRGEKEHISTTTEIIKEAPKAKETKQTETVSPEKVNENIMKESETLENDVAALGKDLEMSTEDNTIESKIPFAEKASKMTSFLTKLDTYTESIKKTVSENNVLGEKTTALIKKNLQNAKDILMYRPKIMMKEIHHIKGDITKYTSAMKRENGFFLNAIYTLGTLRVVAHTVLEAQHKIHDLELILHGEYKLEESKGKSAVIESVNVALFELEGRLINLNEKIKITKIEKLFESRINGLHDLLNTPKEYKLALHDIVSGNPKFGYTAEDKQAIKEIMKKINMDEPISNAIHTEILSHLINKVQPQAQP
ncbi:MAG: hypothetical protein NTX91_03060 [candidate division SR1 bacterium]|nr:hypothetical protein [candidate division SR1 bacterium]